MRARLKVGVSSSHVTFLLWLSKYFRVVSRKKMYSNKKCTQLKNDKERVAQRYSPGLIPTDQNSTEET